MTRVIRYVRVVFSQIDKDKSKFELSQEIMSAFIDARVSDNIGVVAFGTIAYSASPVTYDHDSLKELYPC